jgi:tetratricopeptide (TPR) repeat protein
VLTQTGGENQEALRYYDQAFKIAEKFGNRPNQARMLSGMGVASSELGDDEEAKRQLTRSLAIARETGILNVEALALHNLGTVYEREGDLPRAINQMRQALELWRRIRSMEGEAAALVLIARLEARQGSLEDAARDIEQSIQLSESLRDRLASKDLQASLLARATNGYALKIDILMRLDHLHPGQGYDAQAFETSERARALIDLLTESHADICQGVDTDRLPRNERSNGP